MAAPLPSLSLSDIMHPLSPPPTLPQRASSPLPRPRSSTPEPLEPVEIEDMRRKVLAMGWVDSPKGKEKANSREQELADMLLRITHPAALPQPSQLHAQAETISHLIQQRDFLVKRSMEEHERWESEREGWARAAHALILQGHRDSAHAEREDAVAAQYALVTTDASTQRLQEFEHANSTLQSDKKILQQKLTDTQSRLASLESELAQLRPLLLMQPFALTHSHPIDTSRGWSAAIPSPSTPTSTRRGRSSRRLHDDVDGEDGPESGDEILLPPLQPRPQFRNPILRPVSHDHASLQPPLPISPQKPKGDYYRRREAPASTVHYPSAQYSKHSRRKAGAVQTSSTKPTLSDARTEHLLLAARKIGMQRASILSGAFAHMHPPPEPPSHPKQKPPSSPSKAQCSPKTPRRNANTNTPLLTRTPLGQAGTSPAPRTPLQSLLSAAQSVLSAPGVASSSMVESPLAKRRKLDHPMTIIQSADPPLVVKKERGKDRDRDKGKGKGKGKERDKEKDINIGKNKDMDMEIDKDKDMDREREVTIPAAVARVKSALDFLADQAEVYGTQPGSQDSAGDGESQPRDGDEATFGDLETEGAFQPANVAGSDDASRSKGDLVKGKEKACAPISTSKPRSPNESFDVEEGETQRTIIEPRSQGTTPPASLGAFSDPFTSFSQSELTMHQLPRANENLKRPSTPSGALVAPLTLAPAIDLTPRASPPPAPLAATADAPSDTRSRSGSPLTEHRWPRALSAPAVETSSGSFSMFTLQRPQPISNSGVDSAVLELSSSNENLVQEKGLSMDVASKLVESIKFVSEAPRRTRSPYIKWTKEEDELLAKAVAKYGQKWDLVQKALPSRGYHQVRQRWLRKLGVFDSSKLDLSSLQTNAAAEFLNISTAPPTDENDRRLSEPLETANPKLGLAPLNSEKTLTTSSSSGDSLSPLAPGGSVVARSSSWPAGGHGEGAIGHN